jgi:hypothetical protein
MRQIACIGKNPISPAENSYIEHLGAFYAEKGFAIGSTHSKGADQAFVNGALTADPHAQITLYLPYPKYNERDLIGCEKQVLTIKEARAAHWSLVLQHHIYKQLPQTERMLLVSRILMTMNSCFLLASPDLNPSEGDNTWHAIDIAKRLGKHVFIATPEAQYFA